MNWLSLNLQRCIISMYKEVATKKEYRDLIEGVLKETDILIQRFPQISMYKNIYDQIIDIKATILIGNIKLSDDEIYKRYTLGAIATKNFDSEKELYARKLEDIFGAMFEYFELPEN